MWKFPAVFVAMFALDFVWAFYTKAMQDSRSLHSANWAALIVLLNGFGVMSYANDAALLIPAITGAWSGTYVAVRKAS